MHENLHLDQIITGEAQRDAVHIAVCPVTSAFHLPPGSCVELVPGTLDQVRPSLNPIGVISPFLKLPVKPGERCWMFLNPGSITSLRHEWTHPAFPKEPATMPIKWEETSEGIACCGDPDPPIESVTTMGAAMLTISRAADKAGWTYTKLMSYMKQIHEAAENGDFDYYIHMGSDMDYDAIGNWPELWDAYETITGANLPSKFNRNGWYFSCSC